MSHPDPRAPGYFTAETQTQGWLWRIATPLPILERLNHHLPQEAGTFFNRLGRQNYPWTWDDQFGGLSEFASHLNKLLLRLKPIQNLICSWLYETHTAE